MIPLIQDIFPLALPEFGLHEEHLKQAWRKEKHLFQGHDRLREHSRFPES